MKKIFSVFASWVLLLFNCTFLFADSITPEDFNDFWYDDNLLPNNVYYNYEDDTFMECENAVRGCVRNAKQQITWSFNNPGDVEIRKLVMPTRDPWKFNIHLMVRGKNVEQSSSDQKLCSVVVFDKSSSMSLGVGSLNPWSGSWDWEWGKPTWDAEWHINAQWDKWQNAVSWAIEFSNIMVEEHSGSLLWLVFFWTTWEIARWFSGDSFDESLFDDRIGWSTNIHAWLLKAKELFDSRGWSSCDKKYIILMSDWQANCHMENWVENCDTISADQGSGFHQDPTITRADFLKYDWIKIYAIWYDIASWSEAENTLKYISSDYQDKEEIEDSHTYYYRASVSDIGDIFNDIWENQIVINNMKITSIVDLLWDKILWDGVNLAEESSINIAEEANITESWVVYSFPIRIDPTASWWTNTNSWLVMNYINSDWDNVNLEIPADMSSEIYWKHFLNCSWSYPSWDWVVTWSSVFSQIRDEPLPANRWQLRWNNDSLILTPDFMFWSYADKDNPGECEWTCGPWYTVNDLFNWCEKIEKKNTVNIAVSPAWFGTVSSELIVANDDSPISANWNELTIWTTTVTATPATWDVQYTYEFSWRNLDDCGETITDSCTITAEFRQVNYIKLDIIPNNFEYWTVDVSSGYFYPRELSIETSGNVLRVTRTRIWSKQTLLISIATPNVNSEKFSYRFVGRSIPDSCSGFNNFGNDCTVIANFARSTNEHLITFKNYDWSVLQSWMVEYWEMPSYEWQTPKKIIEWYTSTFLWWDPEITGVTNAQVYTAVFKSDPNNYTVLFDWNWATTWIMDDQAMVYDVEYTLVENKFVKEWKVFKWWNTKKDWSWKSYIDKASVKNLATSGTIVLYAQWWDQDSWWGYSWWWGWWGWKENKDSCPDGDYSWDFYDKKCWTKINTWKVEEKSEEVSEVKPVVVTPSNNKTIKRCSIEWSKHTKEVNEAYVWACQNWIIKSDTIQGARLWEFLNRAEMAKIVTVFEMLVLDAKPDRNKDCSAFADSISYYNSEMRNYMITSCQLERMWIHTADHKPISDFMPKKFVSRAEFWTILSRVLWWNKYEASRNSSKYYVQHLNSLKWGTILSNINPDLKERRSYAVLMIYRAAKSLWKA